MRFRHRAILLEGLGVVLQLLLGHAAAGGGVRFPVHVRWQRPQSDQPLLGRTVSLILADREKRSTVTVTSSTGAVSVQ